MATTREASQGKTGHDFLFVYVAGVNKIEALESLCTNLYRFEIILEIKHTS
jgi:hypothetical protein